MQRTPLLWNEWCIAARDGGYYVAGTRIGLDVVTCDFRNGRSAEAIFEAYPRSSRPNNPMPADVVERFERAKSERSAKLA